MKKTLRFLSFIAISLFWILPGRLLAETSIIPDPNTDHHNPVVTQRRGTFAEIFSLIWDRILDLVFLLLGMAAVLYLIYAGIQYISAGSNAEQTKKARQTIINVILGIVVLVAAYAIVNALIGFIRGLSGG